jgi:hypothetical protein
MRRDRAFWGGAGGRSRRDGATTTGGCGPEGEGRGEGTSSRARSRNGTGARDLRFAGLSSEGEAEATCGLFGGVVALVFDHLFVDLDDLSVTAAFEDGLKGLNVEEVVFLDLDDLEVGVDEAAEADVVIVETMGEVSAQGLGFFPTDAEDGRMLSFALCPVDEALDGVGIP